MRQWGKLSRVYIILLIGIVIGISISSFLQTFALSPAAGSSIAGSSIADKGGESSNFERNSKRDSLQTNDGMETEISNQPSQADYPLEDKLDLSANMEESIDLAIMNQELPKKQLYMEQNWQGRNMQDYHHADPSSVVKLSDELSNRIPLMIAVVTSVQQLTSQTIAIHATWAKNEKNIHYFVGDVRNMPHLPHGMEVHQLEGVDDRQATWEMKEMAIFKYIVAHYSEQVDWYLIVSDDTYVKPNALQNKLRHFNPNVNVYMGQHRSDIPSQCDPQAGVVYSKGLLARLEKYLPQCLGEELTLGACITQRGIHCTRAQETQDLFYIDHKRIIETLSLYSSKPIIDRALTLYPIRYPKFMYRLYSYLQEIRLNVTINDAQSAINEIKTAHVFVPEHLRSSFQPPKTIGKGDSKRNCPEHSSKASSSNNNNDVKVRPRYIPKNKFEINTWNYFNQTRLMSIDSDHPSRGIIGGVREEARYMLTKGISIVNQELSSNEKLSFDKLENGYHRVDPMRGSEYILDFVFRKANQKSTRVMKRVSLLRPFHDTVVPIDAPQLHPRVNFIVTLSGLSNRLEQFLKTFENTVLIPKEHASLTIALYDSPDAENVYSLINQYVKQYPEAMMEIVRVKGTFARGVGLHQGMQKFKSEDLLFFVDIDLEIGSDFLKRARLNAILGKQVYFPIFFKLYKQDFVNRYYKGNSTQLLSRHRGHWAHYSYGMVVIYASDYKKVGGFNTEMKGWGEEDVDFFNKVLHHGLEVFRAPDPGLIHLWHPKVCNQNTVVTKDAYLHCLQSKAENLADRAELAEYVFQNELKAGNTL